MRIIKIEDNKMHLQFPNSNVNVYIMEEISSDKGIYKLRKDDNSAEPKYEYIYKSYRNVVGNLANIARYRNLPIISELLFQEVGKILFGEHAQRVHLLQGINGNPYLLIDYIDGLQPLTRQMNPKQPKEINFKESAKPEYQGRDLPSEMTDGSIDNMMEVFIGFVLLLQLDPHFANLMFSKNDNKAKKVDNEQCFFWKFDNACDFIKFFLHNLYFYCGQEEVLKSLSHWLLQEDFADTLNKVAQTIIKNENELKQGLEAAINVILANEKLRAGLPVVNGKVHLKYNVDKMINNDEYLPEEQLIELNSNELFKVLKNNALYMQEWAKAICQYQGYKGCSKNNNDEASNKVIDALKVFDYRAFEDIDKLPLEIMRKQAAAKFGNQITKAEIAMLSISSILLAAGTALLIMHESINKFIEEKIIAFEQEIINKYIAQCAALLCFVTSITLAGIVFIPEIKRIVDLNNEIDFLNKENSKILNLDQNKFFGMCDEYKLYLL